MEEIRMAVVGDDADMELRDGHLKFDFIMTNKPVIQHGDQRIVPDDYGFAVMNMTDGRWTATFVQIVGHHARVRSDEPTKKKVTITYPFDFTRGVIEEGDLNTWHPDFAPPGWLVNFIRGFEKRLNGGRLQEC